MAAQVLIRKNEITSLQCMEFSVKLTLCRIYGDEASVSTWQVILVCTDVYSSLDCPCSLRKASPIKLTDKSEST